MNKKLYILYHEKDLAMTFTMDFNIVIEKEKLGYSIFVLEEAKIFKGKLIE